MPIPRPSGHSLSIMFNWYVLALALGQLTDQVASDYQPYELPDEEENFR
jgi:hypothetical protein